MKTNTLLLTPRVMPREESAHAVNDLIAYGHVHVMPVRDLDAQKELTSHEWRQHALRMLATAERVVYSGNIWSCNDAQWLHTVACGMGMKPESMFIQCMRHASQSKKPMRHVRMGFLSALGALIRGSVSISHQDSVGHV